MSADDKPKIKLRELSLAQLQHLAARGSRHARAELERRMAEADAPRRNIPSRAAPAGTAPAPKPKLVTAASLDEMAALAATSSATSSAPGMTFPGNHEATPPTSRDAEILRLQAQAQQDEAHLRAKGPPGLVGMALMAWGAMVLFGGLVLLTRKGGLYYILFGLACAAIGWLLFRCKQAALWLHAVCAVAALLWAWHGYTGNTFFTALMQSAPIWISALWIIAPQIREPLS